MRAVIRAILLSILAINVILCESDFWHISDHHLDFYYNQSQLPDQVCPSSYGEDVINPGVFGDYRCDSPWELITSSVYAMQKIEPNPSFIIWTGDDTMHTSDENKYLSEESVISSIQNITDLIKNVFPTTKVFPSVGNHDFLPKNQLSLTGNTIIAAMAEMWKDWLSSNAYESFKLSGYYWEYLDDGTTTNILISLNTVLWYKSNKLVTDSCTNEDAQFDWMESLLEKARSSAQNVYIIGHIPPGYFELASDAYWLYASCNMRYVDTVTRYYDVIKGQFFGHHHTDSFKLFKDDQNRVVSSMLLGPGVTPWMTNYPGVVDGANNPGIRLISYNEINLNLNDFRQYFLNLSSANAESDSTSEKWELAYRPTDLYSLDDITTSSLEKLSKTLWECADQVGCTSEDNEVLQSYSVANSVMYNYAPCRKECHRNHYCAITELIDQSYNDCILNWPSSFTQVTPNMFIIFSLFLASYQLLL